MSFEKFSGGPEASHNLFCFPYAGGAAKSFIELAQALPADIALYAYEFPGRGMRFSDDLISNPLTLIEESYVDLVLKSRGKPFSLFGHSNGGLFAYALGQKLLAQEIRVQNIFISAEAPPHITELERDPLTFSDKEIKQLFYIYGGTTDELIEDPDFIALFAPILIADLSVNYHMKHNLCHTQITQELVIIAGQQDLTISEKSIKEWQQYTTAGIKYVTVNSDHFFINSHANDVASLVLQELTITCGVL